jgi:anti-sigma factor RsiW
MEINRHNYEAFLLDLLEGRLSAEDRQQLSDFLLLNPDCADELAKIDPWVLEKEKVVFRKKTILKKELPDAETELADHNFGLFSIARLEGDLTGEQEQAHREMLEAHPEKAVEWIRWQRTRLVPGRILFKGKEKLKHKNGSGYRTLWISLVSAAAAITLLLLLFRTPTDLIQREQAAGPQQSDTRQESDAPQQFDTRQSDNPRESDTPQYVENPGQTEDQASLNQADETQPARTQNVEDRAARIDRTQTAENQASQETRIQTPEDRAPVQVVQVPLEDMPEKADTPAEDTGSDRIQFASVPSTRLNSFSPAGLPVQDKIVPLDVPEIPVHMSSLSVSQISDMGLMNAIEEYSDEKNFSFWTVANAGINGINKLAGSDISLMASRDEEGEVSGFRLKGKRFSITRPIGQEE